MTDESAKDSIILHLERELKSAKMTLRDRFAMQAMNGILCGQHDFVEWSDITADSYALADAMMGARKQ